MAVDGVFKHAETFNALHRLVRVLMLQRLVKSLKALALVEKIASFPEKRQGFVEIGGSL